jgi:D-alanyl-D-alanine carboxypeptidase/D-alanyl-D-alanine-endopeptidase (penicillin-binding protein 4)
MSLRARAGLALGFLLLTPLGSLIDPEPAAAEQTLEERLDAALGHRGLSGARIAALVVDQASGEVLYARTPDKALVPASNMKVLTSLAVLSAFGPAHRFETAIYADAPIDAVGGVEWLYVRGGGDPALTSEDLWRLAADLRRAGLHEVRRGIVVDASLFDDQTWHPSWGKISARAYNAPIGAFAVNYGSFAVRVAAGRSTGDPVVAIVDPPVPFLRLTNRAQTVRPRARASLTIDRKAGAGFDQVLVTGSLREGAEKVHYRSVADPVRYAGSVLRHQLLANDIAVGETLERGNVPEEATELLRFAGQPLGAIVRRFMKWSNNHIGESLVKSLAAQRGAVPAGWSEGIRAVRAELERNGIDVSGLNLVDGSGLSYDNKVTPRAFVTALLQAERSFRFGPEFVAALPIAAADGTLKKRTPNAAYGVRAKTGNLTRVTGLSGYAHRPGGGVAVFSVLVNGFRRGTEDAWEGVDGFVTELVGPEPERLVQDLRPPG